MYQAPLPQEYARLEPEEAAQRIKEVRANLGQDVVILGHHYQRDEVIRHADFRGDSYKLCLDASTRESARFLVFCGVHFMAESAAILTDKRVLLPNLAAGCSMADMASLLQVRKAWNQLAELGATEGLVPITYINSAANLKGFVGEHGGTVCTSSNADLAVEWALSVGKKVFFFPDQHLGRNTAVKLGFKPADAVVWDPYRPLGGSSPEELMGAKFILWKGHCSVHARFAVEQITRARCEFPRVNVIVHPECSLDVVEAADLNGSTEAIIKTVTSAPAGSIWAVGTEINLVSRLAKECPDKKIFCLDPQICPCSTMYRIHPSFLLWTLESLERGEVRNEIKVPDRVSDAARTALDRMLRLSSVAISAAG